MCGDPQPTSEASPASTGDVSCYAAPMLGRFLLPLAWWLIILLTIASLPSTSQQVPMPARGELVITDPLGYALVHARRSNNQSAVSEVAIRYAEAGNFAEAMLVNEAATAEDWQTEAFARIALEYWKRGQKEKARELFLRVAGLPLPKDVIHIWGDVIENMAEAQQFDLALDAASGMAAAGGTTADSALGAVVEGFVQARVRNPNLPDILPRVIAIAQTLGDSGDEAYVRKKVAVAYIARGEFDRALKIIRAFKEDYDREDGAQELAIQFAKLGHYDRALKLAERAGDYFGPIALVGIAWEALRRRDKSEALEVVTRADLFVAKAITKKDYEPFVAEAERLSELAVLYSQLDRSSRALELAELAFKIAKEIGKPGERYRALKSAADAFCELGLYDNAIEVAVALNDYEQIHAVALTDIGIHAQKKGRLDAVSKLIKTIQAAQVKEHEEFRVKTLVAIARAGIEQGRSLEAQQLLRSINPIVNRLESTEHTPEILKEFAVALAEVGNVRGALEQIALFKDPYFTTSALIDIGTLCAKKQLTLNRDELRLLDQIVGAEQPAEIQPERMINENGWEIPGLAQATMLRPPELQRTRDRSIELYYTFYEPEVPTFLKRTFQSRRKPKPEEAQWISAGLKVTLIEERVINARKFCYKLTMEEIFYDKVTGSPRYTDHTETLLYYDEDGDGKFETLEEGLDYFAHGHIPKWVLEK